jgi:hypothetical protein
VGHLKRSLANLTKDTIGELTARTAMRPLRRSRKEPDRALEPAPSMRQSALPCP